MGYMKHVVVSCAGRWRRGEVSLACSNSSAERRSREDLAGCSSLQSLKPED